MNKRPKIRPRPKYSAGRVKNLLNSVKGNNSNKICSNIVIDQNAVVNPGEIDDAINKLAGGGNHAAWMVFMLNT